MKLRIMKKGTVGNFGYDGHISGMQPVWEIDEMRYGILTVLMVLILSFASCAFLASLLDPEGREHVRIIAAQIDELNAEAAAIQGKIASGEMTIEQGLAAYANIQQVIGGLRQEIKMAGKSIWEQMLTLGIGIIVSGTGVGFITKYSWGKKIFELINAVELTGSKSPAKKEISNLNVGWLNEAVAKKFPVHKGV